MKSSGYLYSNARKVFIAGVIIIPFCFIIVDAFWGLVIPNYPLTLEYFPSFVATYLGVFLALWLESYLSKSEDEMHMEKVKEIIEKELQRNVKYLTPPKGNQLDTQVWKSLINSGQASLLPIDLQDLLFDIYSEIDAHNIEATITRSTAEDYRMALKNERAEKKDNWEKLSARLKAKEKNLKERMSDFLSMDVLETKKTNQ